MAKERDVQVAVFRSRPLDGGHYTYARPQLPRQHLWDKADR